MPTAAHVTPESKSFHGASESWKGAGSDSSSSGKSPSDDKDVINDIESLRKGIIKTSKHNAQAPYTILLVGETGTGKSTFLEFLDRVLTGQDVDHYEFKTLDSGNEQGGSGGQSQTNSARIYELSSVNDISVRILDTPGLADTRGIDRDPFHKESIKTEIEKHLDAVHAVLILANGSLPRITVSMDYALNALSALFPKSLANNIGFLLSNVPDEIYLNFPDEVIPEVLKHARKFLINNPIALQKNYLKQRDGMNEKAARKRKALVKDAEQDALEMSVELFDWLDGLEPQPTKEITALYEKYQVIDSVITGTLAQMSQAAIKTAEIEKLMKDLENGTDNMNAFSKFIQIIDSPVWRKESAPTLNYLCGKPDCYCNCSTGDNIVFALLRFMVQSDCDQCQHAHWSHFHSYSKWVQRQEPRETIDDAMKQKWEAARDEKERIEALVTASECTLDRLNSNIDKGKDELERLAKEYAALSISGCFSGPLEKAIQLLELHCESMQEKDDSGGQLKKVRGSVETMRRRLEVLKEAKAKGEEALV